MDYDSILSAGTYDAVWNDGMCCWKGDVAGAIEKTWEDASEQIKTVVNKVVFPAIDLVLAVFSL